MPCDQNSKLCLNGATCANDNKGGYKCTCDKGYTGENCEIGNSQEDFFLLETLVTRVGLFLDNHQLVLSGEDLMLLFSLRVSKKTAIFTNIFDDIHSKSTIHLINLRKTKNKLNFDYENPFNIELNFFKMTNNL